MNNFTNVVLGAVVLRGFFGFLCIPALWLFFSGNPILSNFWMIYFFNKGSLVYFPPAFFASFYYFIFVTALAIWMARNKHFLSYATQISRLFGDEKPIRAIACLMLLCFFIKKTATFYFDAGYFDHQFFRNLMFPEIFSAQLTHMLLPNTLGFVAAFVLLTYEKSPKLKLIGFILFLLFTLASFNYGSRGLVVQCLILVTCSLYFMDKITKARALLIVTFGTFFVVFMAYPGETFANRILSLLMRLDVYHIVAQGMSSDVILDGSVKDFGREVGIVSANDKNTGVGLPSFYVFYLKGIPLQFSIILSGILFGSLIGVLLLLVDRTPSIIVPVALCYLFKVVVFWPDMAVYPAIKMLAEVTFLCSCIYILLALFYHRRRFLNGCFSR